MIRCMASNSRLPHRFAVRERERELNAWRLLRIDVDIAGRTAGIKYHAGTDVET